MAAETAQKQTWKAGGGAFWSGVNEIEFNKSNTRIPERVGKLSTKPFLALSGLRSGPSFYNDLPCLAFLAELF